MPFNSGGFNGPPPPQPAGTSGATGIPFGGGAIAFPAGTGIPIGGGAAGTSATGAALYPDTVVRQSDGVSLACSVSKGTRSGTNTRYSEHRGEPEGVSLYNLTFADDPHVDAPEAIFTWTATAAGTLRAPIVLNAIGAAEPPGGGATQWTAVFQRVS